MLHRFQNSRGFSLIEMAIVLLIAGLLIAGAFQLINNMQQQRSDQATANEMRLVVTAVERFLHDQQSLLVSGTTPLIPDGTGRPMDIVTNLGRNWTIDVNSGGTPDPRAVDFFINNYLPPGFDLTDYRIGIHNTGPITGAGSGKPMLKAVVLRTLTNALNESRRSRIASLVGSQGGLVIQNGSALSIAGVQGSWSLTNADATADYRVTPAAGQIAAYTTTIDAQMNTNVLSRIDTGNDEANTMRTDLKMAADIVAAQDTNSRGGFGLPDGYNGVQTDALIGANCGTAGPTIRICTDLTAGTCSASSIVRDVPRNSKNDPLTTMYDETGTYINRIVVGHISNSGSTAKIPTLLRCVRDVNTGVAKWESAIVPSERNWRNVIGTHNEDFPYQNTTGTDIEVSITINGGDCAMGLYVNSNSSIVTSPINTIRATALVASATGNRVWGSSKSQLYATVPNGHWYLIRGMPTWSSCNIEFWRELAP